MAGRGKKRVRGGGRGELTNRQAAERVRTGERMNGGRKEDTNLLNTREDTRTVLGYNTKRERENE